MSSIMPDIAPPAVAASAATGSSVLSAHDIGLSIGPRILMQDVNFHLPEGALLAIAGPNGVGKSTLLKTLVQDVPLHQGRWAMAGKDVKGMPVATRARKLAYLPQHANLSFALPVHQVVEMGLWPHRHKLEKSPAHWVEHCLELTEMAWASEQPYTQLSGGERQRVQLARVLAQVLAAGGPAQRLLLLDEPTSSLDPRHALHVLSVVQQLCAQGLSCVWVVHDINLAYRYASHSLLLAPDQPPRFGLTSQVLTPHSLSQAFACHAELHTLPNGQTIIQMGL